MRPYSYDNKNGLKTGLLLGILGGIIGNFFVNAIFYFMDEKTLFNNSMATIIVILTLSFLIWAVYRLFR